MIPALYTPTSSPPITRKLNEVPCVQVTTRGCRRPHHHGIEQDGGQVVEEGLVVQGVGRLQDDRRKQEVKEQPASKWYK